MSVSIGIVGLPNVGKSTLFNALTDNNTLAANYPFATIEPNTGIIAVPDERLPVLEKMYNAQKVIPATVTFVDIAGLVAGASKGEGLGNKFLANIRECDAIVHVVRAFDSPDVIHVDDVVDPKKDIETINTELILADLQSIEKQLPRLEKEAKANPATKADIEQLLRLQARLKEGKLASEIPELNTELIQGLQLLSTKPVIYVFNVDERGLVNETKKKQLEALVAPAASIFICAKIEEELRGVAEADATELLDAYGIKESGLGQLARVAYDTLELQSYLTAGPKEVRAWTIHQGYTAPQAAGVIHTDFEKGFIAAAIVDFDDLVAAGSEAAAKAAGKMRTEGRDYVMRPGDVVEFRFNVSR
ncbi:MAG: redox-regulated ATPase YchF [Candidatus Microsaccharimonas sossegonensis]|uniref:Ribosome-binding ATPase YchF n=1 Tax=Candidatus Microsaccharimonas sossegonensis TaxID=2506948 RepID=A0A4Q0AIH5_9BACT|nr:MAG: redox-regulated ATPase YchF [Candidatus Microsaccharimonas sossegonensis]